MKHPMCQPFKKTRRLCVHPLKNGTQLFSLIHFARSLLRPSVATRDEWCHYWMLESSAPSGGPLWSTALEFRNHRSGKDPFPFYSYNYGRSHFMFVFFLVGFIGVLFFLMEWSVLSSAAWFGRLVLPFGILRHLCPEHPAGAMKEKHCSPEPHRANSHHKIATLNIPWPVAVKTFCKRTTAHSSHLFILFWLRKWYSVGEFIDSQAQALDGQSNSQKLQEESF